MRAELQGKLNDMIICGYPIFVFGKSVCWPAEADGFFTDEEMAELEGCILSNTKTED